MNQTRKSVLNSDDVVLLATFVSDGDEDAFAHLVRKYERLVWNICCRILHNRCDAEDAFQSTFLLLATKAHRIRKPKSLSSWLYGVAFRTASSIRKQRQRGMLPYENSVDMRLTEDVLAAVARKNENELVSAEIMLMKEKHKTPLLMFYFLGNSTTQIADTLGITISAVEGRLRRAKQALKLQLRLRGIVFDEKFAALLLPVMTISPSLKIATISKALAASITNSTVSLLSKFTIGSNQIGARLMLTKIALSFGLVCISSAGVLHHCSVSIDGNQVVYVNGCESEEFCSTMPIKFIQDDEDENDNQDPSLHDHALEVHNHVYGVYRDLFDWMHGTTDEQHPPVLNHDVELKIVQSGDDEQNEFLLLKEVRATLDRKATTRAKLYGVVRDKFSEEQEDVDVALHWVESTTEVETGVPFLKDIPYVGRLFKNITTVQPDKGNNTFMIESLPNMKESGTNTFKVQTSVPGGNEIIELEVTSDPSVDEDQSDDSDD